LTFNSGNKDGFQTNVYTASEWEKMEKSGAIFLPANKYSSKGDLGAYWSATAYDSDSGYQKYARILFFDSNEATTSGSVRGNGNDAVRLVQDL